MPVRAYYETTSGRLVSVGTVFPVRTPEGLSFNEYDVPADFDYSAYLRNNMWDEATRDFVPRPAKVLSDRLQDIINDSAYADDIIDLWQRLPAEDRTKIRNGLIRLLGGARWRTQNEAIRIEAER